MKDKIYVTGAYQIIARYPFHLPIDFMSARFVIDDRKLKTEHVTLIQSIVTCFASMTSNSNSEPFQTTKNDKCSTNRAISKWIVFSFTARDSR